MQQQRTHTIEVHTRCSQHTLTLPSQTPCSVHINHCSAKFTSWLVTNTSFLIITAAYGKERKTQEQ